MIKYPLNPWLEDIVKLYRKICGESYLREKYERSSRDKDEGLSWREFLVKSALETHLEGNPILQKPLVLMDLSDKAKDILYWAGVDSLYDLLQITAEELDAVCVDEEQAKKEITHCLAKIGKRLRSYPGRTSKRSLSYGYWTIPSPGASHCFNIGRPTLREEWFDTYYRLYGHFENEWELLDAFESVRPICFEGERMPNDYKEIFQAAGNVFACYAKCCASFHIKPRVKRPKMPDLDVRSIYREALRAVVDTLERMPRLAFKDNTPGRYLGTPSDNERLAIADDLTGNECLQLLLIGHVEIKIGLENLAMTLGESMLGEHRDEFVLRRKPLTHPLAGAILRLREKLSDETLRTRYRDELEGNPDLTWEEFITQTAILEP